MVEIISLTKASSCGGCDRDNRDRRDFCSACQEPDRAYAHR